MILDFNSMEELQIYFQNIGLDISKFGTSRYNSLEILYENIKSGEIIMTVKSGRILLCKRVVKIEICYRDKSLYEAEQIHKNAQGQFSLMRENGKHAFFKKLKKEEDYICCAIRAMEEELGIKLKKEDNRFGLFSHLARVEERESFSYPGTMTREESISYTIFLRKREYKEEGYIRDGKNMISIYKWRSCPKH